MSNYCFLNINPKTMPDTIEIATCLTNKNIRMSRKLYNLLRDHRELIGTVEFLRKIINSYREKIANEIDNLCISSRKMNCLTVKLSNFL